jgi:hypothetical protein
MDFDFYQQYKDYTNIDLLKIVRQPANYQAAAVAAAEDILRARQVSENEILFVDQYFQDLINSEKDKKEKIDALKDKVTDFLEPIYRPHKKVEPSKWLNILLLFIAIQYAQVLFNTAKRLISFSQCNYCSFDITIIVGLFTLLYVPVIFFLLFKKRRWGWILLFADNLFVLISSISQSYIFFKYQHIHNGDITSFLVPILIRIAFMCFLWRDSIMIHFGVTYEIKKKTALITSAGTLLFILLIYLLFN